MELLVPSVTAFVPYRGSRIKLVRDRRPVVERGHPILAEIGRFMKPLEVDYPAPVKTRAPAKTKAGDLS